MTVAEDLITASLRSLYPREGFQAELHGSLGRAATRPRLAVDSPVPGKGRWLVVGTVAGVVSATGAAYWGVRRHRHRRVA